MKPSTYTTRSREECPLTSRGVGPVTTLAREAPLHCIVVRTPHQGLADLVRRPPSGGRLCVSGDLAWASMSACPSRVCPPDVQRHYRPCDSRGDVRHQSWRFVTPFRRPAPASSVPLPLFESCGRITGREPIPHPSHNTTSSQPVARAHLTSPPPGTASERVQGRHHCPSSGSLRTRAPAPDSSAPVPSGCPRLSTSPGRCSTASVPRPSLPDRRLNAPWVWGSLASPLTAGHA